MGIKYIKGGDKAVCHCQGKVADTSINQRQYTSKRGGINKHNNEKQKIKLGGTW